MRFTIVLAWRNILRHKGKSLAIGVILTLGTVIMTLGNAVISGFENGLSKHFTDDFCGDLLLISPEQEDHAVLFPPMGRNVEPIGNFLEVKPLLTEHTELVQAFLPAASGLSFVLDDRGNIVAQTLLGVNYEDYVQMFPDTIHLISGVFPESGENGVLISTQNREKLLRRSGIMAVPKNANEKYENAKSELVFLGLGDKNSSYDILSPVRGIFEFNGLNAILGKFNLIDIESFRESMGYFSAYAQTLELSAEEVFLLENDTIGLEGLLNEAFEEQVVDDFGLGAGSLKVKKPKLKQIDSNAGVFNEIFIKLTEGISLQKGQLELELLLKNNAIDLKVITWKEAIGSYWQLAYLMRIFLLSMVSLVFLLAILIIINTLTIAAFERTVEIATMRAIGAQKSLIGLLFFMEPVLLAVGFGGIGIFLGILISESLAWLEISSTNPFLQVFFGGDVFRPQVTFKSVLWGVAELAIVTVVTVTYPVFFARKIRPVLALARQ